MKMSPIWAYELPLVLTWARIAVTAVEWSGLHRLSETQ